MAEPEVDLIGGDEWLACPFECGFRVRDVVGMQQMAKDTIDVHVQVSHELSSRLSSVRHLLSPPPDPRGVDAKLWTRRKGA